MKEVNKNKKKKVNKVTEEQFQMLATQIWIFLFGICIGWTILFPMKFWWLPLLDIGLLILTRNLIHTIDKKERRRANDNSRKNR